MKKQSLCRKTIFLLAAVLFTFPILANNTPTEPLSIFDELHYQELVEVNLELNMAEVSINRNNSEKHDAVFSFQDKNGFPQKWEIQVSQRGKFRRMKCENLPPLKLNFKKYDLGRAGLAAFDDMKLVTHCLTDNKAAKELLVKEYLAYKMYNHLSKDSYRVQFIKINYKDVVSGNVESQFGFLIEDTAQLRARIGAEKKEKAFNIPKMKFNNSQIKLLSLFQYMIGNSDWSITGARNVKVLLKNEKHILVPYDFDFAGLVDAPYAVVNKDLGIVNPKERVFLGFREDATELISLQRYLMKNKSVLVKTIRDCKLLNRQDQEEMVMYLDSFFNNSEPLKLPNKMTY